MVVGHAVGRAIVWLRERLNDAPLEITLSLLSRLAAHLPADRLGLSGALATLTFGRLVQAGYPAVRHPPTRLQLSTIVGGQLGESLQTCWSSRV